MTISKAKEMIGKIDELQRYKLHKTSVGKFTDDDGSVVSWVEFVGIHSLTSTLRVITAYSNGRVIWNGLKTDFDRFYGETVML